MSRTAAGAPRLRRPTPGRVVLATLVVLSLAPPAWAETRRLEVVGAVASDGPTPGDVPVREAALQAALTDGVRRVARQLLAEEGGSSSPLPLADVLGGEPTAFAQRYRILEDRGERRALLVNTPGVSREYVVLVEVHVDVDRVLSLRHI